MHVIVATYFIIMKLNTFSVMVMRRKTFWPWTTRIRLCRTNAGCIWSDRRTVCFGCCYPGKVDTASAWAFSPWSVIPMSYANSRQISRILTIRQWRTVSRGRMPTARYGNTSDPERSALVCRCWTARGATKNRTWQSGVRSHKWTSSGTFPASKPQTKLSDMPSTYGINWK